MKKLIFLLFIPLVFCGCQIKSYTPVIDTSFCYDAIFKTGDFSYSCTIDVSPNATKITVNDTYAKGMIITYNGSQIRFEKNDLAHTLDSKNMDKTNPAIIIFEVFSYIQSADDLNPQKTDTGFKYTGITSLGEFILLQNQDNTFHSIQIPDAHVTIEFKTI